MVGTFGGALEARQIDASNGKLTADVTGEVETEEGVLVIRRIHVAMRLEAPETASARRMPCPSMRTAANTNTTSATPPAVAAVVVFRTARFLTL